MLLISVHFFVQNNYDINTLEVHMQNDDKTVDSSISADRDFEEMTELKRPLPMEAMISNSNTMLEKMTQVQQIIFTFRWR